jgi:hypothetical protein
MCAHRMEQFRDRSLDFLRTIEALFRDTGGEDGDFGDDEDDDGVFGESREGELCVEDEDVAERDEGVEGEPSCLRRRDGGKNIWIGSR